MHPTDPPAGSFPDDAGAHRAHGGTDPAQKILAAFPPLAISKLEVILGGNARFLPVHTLADAKAVLQAHADGISLVACGVHFDESRMFDLLRYVRASFPRLPFVCCRLLETRLSRIFIEATSLSATNLGAETYFDLPERAIAVGKEAAERELRGLLLRAIT